MHGPMNVKFKNKIIPHLMLKQATVKTSFKLSWWKFNSCIKTTKVKEYEK